MRKLKLLRETLVAFDKAGADLPGDVTRDKLDYWRRKGVVVGKGKDKHRVKLEYIKIGGRPHTSREAYERFLEASNVE